MSVGQSFNWAVDIQSDGFDEGYDLVTDVDGNVYVAGQIEFETNFGNGIILESAGVHDIFLAKYTNAGNLVWAKRAGGKGGDKIQSITLDGFGHIFVAGEIDDTVYFENIMLTTGERGINNMFIAKYDTSGSVIWVRDIDIDGAPHHTRGYGVTCDEQGNVYACGGTNGDTYYNGNLLFSTTGDYDATVVKFDPNGNFRWARRMGGADSDKAYGIASDHNGYLYVTGYFVGHADFSPNTSITGSGHTDIFLAKFDTAGMLQWVQQAGDTGFDRGYDVTVNVNGNILITGEFQTGYFGSHLVHSMGHQDMFLASYDVGGNNLWALGGGGPEDDVARGVSHDVNGNVYVIGDYASTGNFPPYSITSNGFADIFIAKYNSGGTSLDWVRSIGGTINDRGRGVGTDPEGNVYTCGEYVNSMQMDATTLTGQLLLDIFVSKIGIVPVCAMQISSTTKNTCTGSCNGTAFVTPTGQFPFIYQWSTIPPQTNAFATGLCEGNYSVTITDSDGCSATASITINEIPAMQITTNKSDVSCNGICDGIATANVTGISPFTFTWSTTPPQSTATATGLCTGVYDVFITDSEGCSISSSFTITEPPPLLIAANVTNASCIGCTDGVIDINVTGGTDPYNFTWSNGSTSQDLYNISAGIYDVCITDVNNCSLCDTFSVQQPSTGISEFATGAITVYPNPVHSSFMLKMLSPVFGKTRIELFNSIGQLVYESSFAGNEIHVQLPEIPVGTYFIRLNNQSENREKMIPVVVE